MKIEEVFARRRFIMLDGAMGTQLQLRGLTTEQKPELAAFIMPDVLTAVHRDYARAGADILLANTFGANPRKLKGTGYTVQQVIEASIACARTAAQETGALVALDIGPIGELLAPAGTLPFEDACAQFAEMVRAGAAAGADLVFLETMTDLYELKAAILAAKENCDLPVFTSMSFEARGRTFTGCTVESYGITAAGLGADAVGINCSLGPKEILPFAQRLCRVVPAGMPVFVKPNAGLPNLDGSYDITPAEFAAEMAAYLPTGISMLGGCCGSEPESIRLLKELTQDKTPAAKTPIVRSRLCTPVRCVEVNGITVVGERINPTGKKRLQQALREGDSAYACAQAVAQAEAGAELLDVNAGLPDPSPTCHCSWILPTKMLWPARCAFITASRSSTRSTASRRCWTAFCPCAKSTAPPWLVWHWMNTAFPKRQRAALRLPSALWPQRMLSAFPAGMFTSTA